MPSEHLQEICTCVYSFSVPPSFPLSLLYTAHNMQFICSQTTWYMMCTVTNNLGFFIKIHGIVRCDDKTKLEYLCYRCWCLLEELQRYVFCLLSWILSQVFIAWTSMFDCLVNISTDEVVYQCLRLLLLCFCLLWDFNLEPLSSPEGQSIAALSCAVYDLMRVLWRTRLEDIHARG